MKELLIVLFGTRCEILKESSKDVRFMPRPKAGRKEFRAEISFTVLLFIAFFGSFLILLITTAAVSKLFACYWFLRWAIINKLKRFGKINGMNHKAFEILA